MASFSRHLVVSSGLGVGYAIIVSRWGTSYSQAALAGALCAASGLLPNLDRASDKPVRGLFGITAAAVALLQLKRLQDAGLSTEGIILLMAVVYLAFRFLAGWVFQHLSAHRGMCHSIPAAIIAAEVVFLAYDCPEPHGPWVLALGVLLGFMSHLLMDDFHIVDAHRELHVAGDRGTGVGLKLISRNIGATLATWILLAGLTYLVGVKEGYCQPPDMSLVEGAISEIKYLLGNDYQERSSWKRTFDPPPTPSDWEARSR